MRFSTSRAAFLAAIFLVCFHVQVLAAGSTDLQNIRFHSGEAHDRVVLDLERLVNYKVRATDDGKCIMVDLDSVSEPRSRIESFAGTAVESISYEETDRGLTVKIYLAAPAKYKVEKLRHPARIFIDVIHPAKQKNAKQVESDLGSGRRFIKPVPTAPVDDDDEDDDTPKTVAPINPTKPRDIPRPYEPKRPAVKPPSKGKIRVGPTPDYTVYEISPGLTKTLYSRWNDDGPVVAYFIEADKNKYELKPALDDGQVIGRGTVSYIADEYNATAAVNASYFDWDGTLIGIVKIDGVICGTTYYKRSSMGIMPDGSIFFGQPTYSGLVTLGNVSLPVAGVDVPRGEDMLVVYNRFYGERTGTNEHGREYVVKNGKVVAINRGNSKIPYDAQVISVHGATAAAFDGVKVGDFAEVLEDLGGKWNETMHILGAGPCLIERGRVRVNSGEEKFPPDIARGRAPRSAVGITDKGNYVFAVVDGRSSQSHGCTLAELARLLREYGCREAINLDGGGSSAIVLNGELLNVPSDGSERPVASALILLPRR